MLTLLYEIYYRRQHIYQSCQVLAQVKDESLFHHGQGESVFEVTEDIIPDMVVVLVLILALTIIEVETRSFHYGTHSHNRYMLGFA